MDLYKERGYLDVADNPSFRLIVDACNALGQNYKGAQRGWYKSKVYDNHFLWFPKLYENEEWNNKISENGSTITELCKDREKKEAWFIKTTHNPVKRIVFVKNTAEGDSMYRFVGVFETDIENSSIENGIIHRLTNKRFKL